MGWACKMATPDAIDEAEATNTLLQQPATTTLDPDAHLVPGLDAQPPVGRRKPCRNGMETRLRLLALRSHQNIAKLTHQPMTRQKNHVRRTPRISAGVGSKDTLVVK